jgi:hypothetical protein
VSAGVWKATGRAENTGGGGVQFGLEAVGFRRLAQIFIQAEHVKNGRATLRISRDVLGAVVTMRDTMNVQLPPATVAALAVLCNRVDGAVKGTSDGSEQGAYGVPVQAAGVV